MSSGVDRKKGFEWHPNEPPPKIRASSKAKLEVLRTYLSAYVDRLNVGLPRDEFKLDLVDGFAGGGTFRDGEETIPGTPLIMLEEVAKAEKRINANRKKPVRFDCKYYFVDKNPAHTDHLRKVLDEREYRVTGGDISVYTNRFESVADRVIAEIARRQPLSGRAIFLLDQTGYSQVTLGLIARIFQELRDAEVILTFAEEVLTRFLDTPQARIAVKRALNYTDPQIDELIGWRDGDGGRAVVQRTLLDHTLHCTKAAFFTPFFIRPAPSRRALWFLHLSRHPTARDVMVQQHWRSKNTFVHFGKGGFGMFGWDALRHEETLPLFGFDEIDGQRMLDQLQRPLLEKIHRLTAKGPVSMERLRYAVANGTAARFDDMDGIVRGFAGAKQIEITTRDGKRRPRALKLSPSDLIARPATLILPGLSLMDHLPHQ